MRARSWAIPLVLLAALASIQSGATARENPNISLIQAKVYYQDLEFEKCLRLLKHAAKYGSPSQTDLEQIEIYTGLCEAGMGRRDLSELHFRRALEMNPKGTLPEGTSPALKAQFETLRATIAPPAEPAPPSPPAPEPPPSPPPAPSPQATSITSPPAASRVHGEARPRRFSALVQGGMSYVVGARYNWEVAAGAVFARYGWATIGTTYTTAPAVTAHLGGRLPRLIGPMGLFLSLDGDVFFAQGKRVLTGGGSLGVTAEVLSGLELYTQVSGGAEQPLTSEYVRSYLLVGAGFRLQLPMK